MNIALLLRLLTAHLIADFALQPNWLNAGKQRNAHGRPLWLVTHSAVQAVMAWLLSGMWTCWMIPLVIFVTHLAIDYIKTHFTTSGVVPFIIDQLAHIAVIVALWLGVQGSASQVYAWLAPHLANTSLWAIIIAYVIVLKPTSILVMLFTHRWSDAIKNESTSLPDAGKWIGYLERVLIVTFILVGHWEGVGFLLAAKSIFRYGSLSKAKEIKTTEYVLVGTFASFTIAILVGIAASMLIR